MASSSAGSVTRYLEESIPGTIETGNPQVWRVVDGALVQTTTSAQDDEIRNDRGSSDSITVSGTVGGSYNINISHKTHNDFWEALLASTPVPVAANGVKAVADMAFTSTTHTISSASAALPLLDKGQWFSITGAGSPSNNGAFKASSSTAPTTSAIVVDTVVKDVGLTATAVSCVISSTRLKQGNETPLRTFTIERELSDDAIFFTWAKCYVSSATLSYALDQKVKATMSFLGAATEQFGNVSKFAGIDTEVAATTTPYFNSVVDTYVLIDGAEMGDSCIESLSVEINGNLRERRCYGSGLASSSVGFDTFTVKGSGSMFFGSANSAALYAKKISDTSITFTVCVTDSAGNGFAITMPRAKITKGDVPGGSLGSDVMMNVEFEASTDPTLETKFIIDFMGSLA